MAQPGAGSGIDAVVFDVGGVIIDWNPRHLYRKLFDGDAAGMEWFLANVCTPEWNVMQDQGRTWDDAVGELSARHPAHAALIEAYALRWDEMVAGPVAGTAALIGDLAAAGVPLYGLSNFSREKFPGVRRRFPELDALRGIVVSGEIGMIKPEAEIYHHFLDRFGLEAGACVFIDDQPRNVEAAIAAGMRGVVFTSAAALRRTLGELGVL
jgi:2-haloacid dehalogenase